MPINNNDSEFLLLDNPPQKKTTTEPEKIKKTNEKIENKIKTPKNKLEEIKLDIDGFFYIIENNKVIVYKVETILVSKDDIIYNNQYNQNDIFTSPEEAFSYITNQ